MNMPVFTPVSVSSFADGKSFGASGSFEIVRGELTFDVDPNAPANSMIVDLDLAPRQPNGLVRFTSALVVIRPVDAALGNRTVVVDIPNRGRVLSLHQFNESIRDENDPQWLDAGNGFLFEQGYTLASIGWQWDVKPGQGLWHAAPVLPADISGEVVCQFQSSHSTKTMPLGQLGDVTYPPDRQQHDLARLYERRKGRWNLIERSVWQFARRSGGTSVPSDAHVYSAAGFKPGVTYQVAYPATGPSVVGTGFLAVRDFAASLRQPSNATDMVFDTVLGFGASQTGRFLRHFVYEGLNTDVRGKRVFDGVIAHIAGGQRGDFNHRFAQPSALGAAGYGQQFPYAAVATTDPHTGQCDGLVPQTNAPKMMLTNTAWEYWRGDASLIHIDGVAEQDIDEHPDTRVYLFSGCQHIDTGLPLTNRYPALGLHTRNHMGVLGCSGLLRAALVNLHHWVLGTPPPGSRHPRLSDGTAIRREQALENTVDLLGSLAPERLGRMYVVDPGDNAMRIANHYPAKQGSEYPAYVSALDEDSNELSGVRLPDLTVPVGTHTGWNPWNEETGVIGHPTMFFGSTLMFAGDDSDLMPGDPRPSVSSRYANRSTYVQKVKDACSALVGEGYLLETDVEGTIAACLERYDTVFKAAS
jgi:hypothetical protein